MHVLVDIVHPADVLFFLRPIRLLQARGARVTIASRRKDVACELLDAFGLSHTPLTAQGRGMAGLARELLARDLALLRLVRRDRPDVMLGFGGVAISHVGRLTGIPSLVAYDSETATLQTRLAFPFLSRLLVPEDYAGPTPTPRTERLPGIKELSYFHPAAFRPDRARAEAEGLDPARPNVFLRLVRWGANHDVGKTGWSSEQAAALAAALAPHAKLHVSAEEPDKAPEALRPHLWRGAPASVHHLLGACDLYVGESATMACEAVAMGVPAIYAGVDMLGYVRGLSRRGLMTLAPPDRRDALPALARAALADRAGFDAAHAAWLSAAPDWAEIVADRAAALARG